MFRLQFVCVCILLFSLCPAFLLADECTSDDYEASYTECSSQKNNTRDLVYYLKPFVNCSGGVQPHAIYGLPCGIACKPGSYLPLGETHCKACGDGTYSIGGGYRVDTWYTIPDYLPFRRYYYNTSTPLVHGVIDGLRQWTLKDTYIRSGNITDSQAAVLELSVYIASTAGHVSFSYRVNAEGAAPLMWDGIQFDVDGVILLPKISHTNNFLTVTFPLAFGAHVLRWSYIKDNSFSKGEDAAFIRMIEVGGLHYADDYCTECAEGTYFTGFNGTSCLPCPANTFANTTGSDSCTSCPSHQYSFSEAGFCTPRLACTADDYEQFYTPCDATGHRSLVASWLTPIICDTDSTSLPADQTGLACGECTDGAMRNPTTFACDYCPDGSYSTGGAPCTTCSANTAAIKTFAVTQFDDWVPGSSTSCSGDCSNQGWVLHSSYMNSGVGHGSSVNSWFQFNVTLVAAGTLTFDYSIVCPSSQCSLYFSTGSGEPSVYSAPTTMINRGTVALTTGTHTLTWTFSKYDFLSSRNDAASIYSINITSTLVGGAIACTQCAAGTIPSTDQTKCAPCPAGQQSDVAGTTCQACPAGTHNPTPGSVCIPCGVGTWPNSNSTGCVVTCTYSPDNNVTYYDLNPLRSNTTYGPVADKNKQNYYVSICSTLPHHCYYDSTTQIDSYSCQETTSKIVGTNIPLGKDTGHVLGWEPLPVGSRIYNTDLGVIMDLEYGDLGCAASNNNVPKHRSTKIAFLCDPTAGIGFPVGNGSIENSGCTYSFLWRSLYACPVCSFTNDMGYYLSPCQNGQRTKTYYWLLNPPLCHTGTLPEPSIVNCTETVTPCAAGQYLNEDTCVPCKAGTFSVGGGERIMNWSPYPTRFSSQCVAGSTCSMWSGGEDGSETVSSGNGDSVLIATFDFVVPGSVSFLYKVYSPNVGLLTFAINGVEQLKLTPGVSKLGYVNVTIPLAKGSYLFSWTFLSGSEGNATTPRVGAVLKDVTIVGTDYHDDACTPCPAGFRSAVGASSCTPCSIDHYSFADSSTCTACSATTTALPKSSQCLPRPACTAADYNVLYSACTADNTRTRTTLFLQPQFCINATALPADQEVPCAPCLEGTYLDPNNPGQCTVCPAGQYYFSGSCVVVPSGSIVIQKKYYFADNSTNSWPSAFSTSCSGDCGSSGWRVKAGSIDSGYHSTNAVDSMVKLQTTVVKDFASIFFAYGVVSNSTSSLDLYVDGTFITSLFGASTFYLPLSEGTHNLTWNYHQHQQTQGYANLSQIVITGATDADAGSVAGICPPGSYNEKPGSTSCALCPPGYISPKEGASNCDICINMQYNSEFGATECLECKEGSFSTPGATYCSTECKYSTVINSNNVEFSLAGTEVIGPVRARNSSFFFHFCNASLGDAPCNPSKPSHACAVEDLGVGRRDWGGLLEYTAMHAPIVSGSKNTTFAIAFSLGDSDGCLEGTHRSVVFKFQCAINSMGTPIYTNQGSDQCTAVFEWAGSVGCPVCGDADYNTLLGQCVDGMRTVQLIRQTDCNGLAVKAQPSQSCTGTVEFPIAVVFVIVGVIIVLVVAAVIVFIKNRRITAQYSRLKQQADTSNTFDNETL